MLPSADDPIDANASNASEEALTPELISKMTVSKLKDELKRGKLSK